ASSSCLCNTAGLAQLPGSPQRLAVPCEFSTTPLSSGRRGGFHAIATPNPISHSARPVARSPMDPPGQPLSTRTWPGSPPRPKAARSAAGTAPTSTEAHRGGGENPCLEEGARALIDQPQPADPLAAAELHHLSGVHLPDLVRLFGAAVATGGLAAGPGRDQSQAGGEGGPGGGGGEREGGGGRAPGGGGGAGAPRGGGARGRPGAAGRRGRGQTP